MKMLDGSLLIELIKPKTQKSVKSLGRLNTNFSLVATTVISMHLCKISRESFRFLKTLRNVSKIGSKTLHNAPSKEIPAMKSFLVH